MARNARQDQTRVDAGHRGCIGVTDSTRFHTNPDLTRPRFRNWPFHYSKHSGCGDFHCLVCGCHLYVPSSLIFKLNRNHITAVIRTRLVSLDARKLAEESASLLATQRPRSLSPGWSSGRRPSGQKYLRSDSLMGRSLMDANLKRIRPSSLNSQFSLPYERYQFPESSCHS